MSELKLTDREWNAFNIGDEDGVFNIKSTRSGIDKNKLNANTGNIPYITRSDIDNGINLFVTDNQNNKYELDEGNVITIGLDTQTVFYQNSSFYTGQNIQVLRNDNLNYWVAMFIIPLLKIQMSKFSWGSTGATLGRLNKTKIMLPIQKDSNLIDWQFMEYYIKQIEQKQRKQIVNYYNSLLNKEINKGGVERFDGIKWGEFKIIELFTFDKKPSKGLNHLVEDEKGINYIGATNRNNGVLSHVKIESKRVYKGNAIVFIRNGEGSMGYSIYKHEDFIATQDISVGYNKMLNKYSGLFITVIADRVRGKYNFGYKRNQNRLNNEILTLPIDDNKQPNWQFMQDYMKNLEHKKLKQYVTYCEERVV